VLLHHVGSAGHVVHSGASGAQRVIALFFKLRGDWYGVDKKRAGTRYAKRVFLLPVGSIGHVVNSGAPGAQNVNEVFFMVGVGPVQI
jgi:hypothetical protein